MAGEAAVIPGESFEPTRPPRYVRAWLREYGQILEEDI